MTLDEEIIQRLNSWKIKNGLWKNESKSLKCGKNIKE